MGTKLGSADNSVLSTDSQERSASSIRQTEQLLRHIDHSRSLVDTPTTRRDLVNTPSSISTSHPRKGSLDDPREPTVFLGESSPLTCVIDEGHRSPERGSTGPQRSRLRYSIPVPQDIPSARNDFLQAHKKHLEGRLVREGGFTFPSDETSALLLNAYFSWFHPCFPIVDRAAICDTFINRTISPLLVQAMYFIGVSLCTDDALRETGFEDRYQTKFLFYTRAKMIYDADWESNTIVKLQSLFMLSFWRGGPSEERDTRFWLGIAITLAQKRGIHVM